MGGIWLNEGEFLDFGEAVDRGSLGREIASRQAAWDWTGLVGLLPDPDPVLRKLADGGVQVLEALTADAHLMSVIQSRKLGTLRKDYRWGPGALDEAEPTPEAVRLRDQLVADLERVDLYGLFSGLLDAPLYGMTPVEIVWAPPRRGESWLRLVDLVVKPARWFGFDAENRPRFVSQASPWEGEALPFGKFVLARHFPTYDNPYGLRLLSRCFWPVTFKRGGMRFWVTLAEKYGMPFLVGKYGPNATPEQQAEMLAALTRMVQDAVAVIPDNGSVELLAAAGKSASVDIHAGLKTAMDAEISKVIVGQTLTAEVGEKGSYAAAQTHAKLLEDYRDGDQRLIKTTMEEVAWIYGQVNAPGVAAPSFGWWEEEQPKKEMADRDLVISQTGVKFAKSYYMRQYDYQDDDFEVLDAPSPEQTTDGRERGEMLDAPAKDGHAPEATGSGEAGAAFAAPPEGGEPDTPDRQVDRLVDDTAADVTAMIDQIRAFADEAESLEDLQQRLVEAYPDLDAAGLAAAMTEGLAAAALAGRWELLEGV